MNEYTVSEADVKDIASCLFRVLPMLRKRLFRLDVIKTQHGIPLSHAQVLAMLNDEGSMSVSEISQRLGIAKPNITPLVDRLIAEGLVDRVRDTEDRRIVNVVLQPAGQQKLEEIKAAVVDQVNDWGKNLSAEDFAELARSLKSIARVIGSMNG